MTSGFFPDRDDRPLTRREREERREDARDTRNAVGTVVLGALALGFMGSMMRR